MKEKEKHDMFNQADILKAIQAGQDPQDIANGFADALNAAIADAEAAKQKSVVAQAKVAKAKVILDAVADFVETFYPEMYTPEIRKIDPADLVEAADQAYDEIQKMTPVLNDLEKLLKNIDVDNKKRDYDPLEEFLKSNGLK